MRCVGIILCNRVHSPTEFVHQETLHTWDTQGSLGQPGYAACDSQVVTVFPLYFGEPTRLTELNDNICPKLPATQVLIDHSQTHHLLHLWPYTHAWQFLEDNIGNLTQGHKYRVVPANNIGDFDPCNTRYDNILIRIFWMSLILMVVLASLTGVRTMLTLHGLRRSLMSKLRIPIIFLNKRNRGYYYLNESKRCYSKSD